MSTTLSKKQKQTLQALLLSLNGLDALNSDEKEKLENIAGRLQLKQNWEDEIQPKLVEIINHNDQFHQQFTEAQRTIEGMSDEEIRNLFPTVDELEQIFSSESTVVVKVAKPTETPDQDGHHISNMVIKVLGAEEPIKKTQEILQFKNRKKIE